MNNEINWKEELDEILVCFCNPTSKGTVVAAIRAGATDAQAIHAVTGAGFGGQCMELNPRGRCCHPDIKELLEIYGE